MEPDTDAAASADETENSENVELAENPDENQENGETGGDDRGKRKATVVYIPRKKQSSGKDVLL